MNGTRKNIGFNKPDGRGADRRDYIFNFAAIKRDASLVMSCLLCKKEVHVTMSSIARHVASHRRWGDINAYEASTFKKSILPRAFAKQTVSRADLIQALLAKQG